METPEAPSLSLLAPAQLFPRWPAEPKGSGLGAPGEGRPGSSAMRAERAGRAGRSSSAPGPGHNDSPLVPAARSHECHGRAAAAGEVSRSGRLTSVAERGRAAAALKSGEAETRAPSRAEEDAGGRHPESEAAAMVRGRRPVSTIRTWAGRDVTMARPANRGPKAASSAMMSCGPGANRETIELS